MPKLKKRYKFLIVLTAWFMYFYYTLCIGWETDRSHEPALMPWIGKSFRIDEPMLMYRSGGWSYHELDLPHYNDLFPRTLDEFRVHPTEYNRSKFSSLYLLEPGTQFKIIQAFDWSTWAGTFLCIKAILKSGPYTGKKVTVDYLFDTDWKGIIFGPRKDIPISEL